MNEQEQKWIETNNQVCALLRQAHDVLALSSLPPKRPWVGLTDGEYKELHLQMGPVYYYQEYGQAIEAKLKEKNNG